jgi:histidinol-phosphatase (PHP family)
VHCIEWQGEHKDASTRGFLTADEAPEMFRAYLQDVLALIESDQRFDVLSHLDYPKRYWPEGSIYIEGAYEAELRTVLRAAARRDLALEVNTTRGGAIERYLCPGPAILTWWKQEGGRAISLGSDAHSPDRIAAGFDVAAALIEAAGFRRQDDPNAFWLRA